MQQELLEAEYAKHKAKVSAEHSDRDVTNAGAIGPSLVVVTSGRGIDPHKDFHNLGSTANPNQTFATNFNDEGRQDMEINGKKRAVRSAIVSAHQAVMRIGAEDQPHPDERLMGTVELSAGEMAVGLALAASYSQGKEIDLETAIHKMTAA